MGSEIKPLGFFENERKEIQDDNWESVHSFIELPDEIDA